MVRKLQESGGDVRLSCTTLQVSRSGYYDWKGRGKKDRSETEIKLMERIKQIHQESKGTYGSPRITAQLKSEGIKCSRKRVAHLMKQAGLSGVAKKRYRVQTTDSRHDYPIANRIFQTENIETLPERPNQVWASDISYIPTKEGWLYLAIFLDVYTRKVVGYSMADHLRTELVLKALESALLNQGASLKGLVSHSDRGVQYAAESMRKRLSILGIQASMSRKGNCYDNAYAESFFHTLKVELVHREEYPTHKEAKSAIFNYIEGWYNPKRLHSSLGYKSPIDYEQQHLLAA